MYHISTDKRQLASAEKIRNGLTKCLAVKHMTEISVSDIAAAGGVSRSSFYRCFDTPIDVLTYACDIIIDTMLKDYAASNLAEADEFVMFSLEYWKRHSDVLEALVNCDRLDIVRKSITKHADAFVLGGIGKLTDRFSPDEIDYIKMGILGLLLNLLMVWVSHGKKESPEELFRLYRKFRSITIDDKYVRVR